MRHSRPARLRWPELWPPHHPPPCARNVNNPQGSHRTSTGHCSEDSSNVASAGFRKVQMPPGTPGASGEPLRVVASSKPPCGSFWLPRGRSSEPQGGFEETHEASVAFRLWGGGSTRLPSRGRCACSLDRSEAPERDQPHGPLGRSRGLQGDSRSFSASRGPGVLTELVTADGRSLEYPFECGSRVVRTSMKKAGGRSLM